MTKVIELSPNMEFLVIDDSPSSRDNFTKSLKTIGLKNVTEGANEEDAFNLLKQRKFHFIICAKNMRFMNGGEFLTAIKENMKIPRTPFMLIGPDVSKEDLINYTEATPEGFLKTPFIIKELTSKVSYTLSQYLLKGNKEIDFETARIAFNNGDYEKALENYKRTAEKYPSSARPLVGVARCQRALDKLPAAEQALRLAIEKNKNYAQAYIDLAACLLQLGQKFHALQCLDYAIQLNPKNPIQYEISAYILNESGLYEDAEKYLMQAINSNIIFPELYALLAKNFLAQKKIDKAIEYLKRAMEKDSNNPSFLNSVAICYKELGRFNEAIFSYNLAIKISPNNVKILYNKVLCLIKMNELSKALKLCQQILKIDPKFERASLKIIELEKMELEIKNNKDLKGKC